jgi:hypothetical protein
VRTFNNDSADKTLIRVIDRLEFSAGTVMLHLTPFLYTTLATEIDRRSPPPVSATPSGG